MYVCVHVSCDMLREFDSNEHDLVASLLVHQQILFLACDENLLQVLLVLNQRLVILVRVSLAHEHVSLPNGVN